ncbi:hypothetical protein FIBSPDRAFT_867440 [Athelia psychrophila]|uniref:Uncharacterized protein n=1 Tax=Athelia psychrophila TaxID=1759441 RepID=A0A166E2R1_9AGAM|nr:hypothetical protein FIBSPDRAFT_867440 [Fibularhizoctonia sp. CBS 109695]
MCSSPASGAVLPRGEAHADADPGWRADDRDDYCHGDFPECDQQQLRPAFALVDAATC